MDLALAIEQLVPAAKYRGSTTANTEAAYDALVWGDERPKPSWADLVAAYTPPRRKVHKSTVVARLSDDHLVAAKAIFTQMPRLEARWYSPDHPSVYADDPDAIALLQAIGADPDIIMAPEEGE